MKGQQEGSSFRLRNPDGCGSRNRRKVCLAPEGAPADDPGRDRLSNRFV